MKHFPHLLSIFLLLAACGEQEKPSPFVVDSTGTSMTKKIVSPGYPYSIVTDSMPMMLHLPPTSKEKAPWLLVDPCGNTYLSNDEEGRWRALHCSMQGIIRSFEAPDSAK